MSEAKFTKGDWVQKYGNLVKIGNSEWEFKNVEDAALIAAAPEMYAMLETAMNILNGDDFESEVSCEDIKKMLAEARGEA